MHEDNVLVWKMFSHLCGQLHACKNDDEVTNERETGAAGVRTNYTAANDQHRLGCGQVMEAPA
jgi:hypothetical protein